MPDVLLIAGSPAEDAKSYRILRYAKNYLQNEGINAKLVTVKDYPADDLIGARHDSPAFYSFKEDVKNAQLLVIGTPVYKGSFSGSLKALLDILPQYAFREKVVLPIATAGSMAHLLSIDYAFKPVLSILGASEILQGVYITDADYHALDFGAFRLEAGLQERFSQSLKALVNLHRKRAAVVVAEA